MKLLPFEYECIARLLLNATTFNPLLEALKMHEFTRTDTFTWCDEGIIFGLFLEETNLASFLRINCHIHMLNKLGILIMM